MTPIPSQFEPKDPDEEVTLTFDGSAMLAPGETLTGTPTVSVTTTVGTDSTPSLVLSGIIVNSVPLTMLNGKTIATGMAVQAICSEGSFGSTYWIRITVQTSNPNKKLVLKSMLPMAAM